MTDDERWPRPVGGHLALDFVNTDVFSHSNPSTDILRSADEFQAWLSFAGSVGEVSTRAPASDRSVLPDAAALRAALRSIFEAVAADSAVEPEALAHLQTAYADAVRRATPRVDDRRLVWQPEGSSPRAALGVISRASVELLHDGSGHRVKACPGCGFLFLDTTKNGSRRWCSMDDCGSLEKARRYVAKRAAHRRVG
jgi:predicted RNA-binding Zn ribbon-like protein